MERPGVIVEEKGDTAVVRIQRHLSCEGCGRCGGILGKADQHELVVKVLNPVKARTGQRVLVESDDRQVIFVSFMLYIVPLAGLIAGIFLWLNLADYLGLAGGQDLAAAGAGFGLMALIFLGIRVWDRRVKDNPKYKPVITELLKEQGSEETAPAPVTEG